MRESFSSGYASFALWRYYTEVSQEFQAPFCNFSKSKVSFLPGKSAFHGHLPRNLCIISVDSIHFHPEIAFIQRSPPTILHNFNILVRTYVLDSRNVNFYHTSAAIPSIIQIQLFAQLGFSTRIACIIIHTDRSIRAQAAPRKSSRTVGNLTQLCYNNW